VRAGEWKAGPAAGVSASKPTCSLLPARPARLAFHLFGEPSFGCFAASAACCPALLPACLPACPACLPAGAVCGAVKTSRSGRCGGPCLATNPPPLIPRSLLSGYFRRCCPCCCRTCQALPACLAPAPLLPCPCPPMMSLCASLSPCCLAGELYTACMGSPRVAPPPSAHPPPHTPPLLPPNPRLPQHAGPAPCSLRVEHAGCQVGC